MICVGGQVEFYIGNIMENFIPLKDCKHGYCYLVNCRNLDFAVFNEKKKGFIGIRTKFGHRFLDTEYHWDTGAPHGTAKPLKLIEKCPVDPIDDYIRDENGDRKENQALFDYIEKITKRHMVCEECCNLIDLDDKKVRGNYGGWVHFHCFEERRKRVEELRASRNK